ncbi:MAG: low affinity iron permease family protein [Myxococcaceae bacterium]|nr:low affinity iron permease family protein [Myxococcaceae bacterium]
MSERFRRVAHGISCALGTHWAFGIAVLIIVAWAASGPLFGFSEKWQLLINSFTTIVTFLMVFLIQATQNRDARAIQLKLDELIRCHNAASNSFADLEDATEEELDALQKRFEGIRERARPEKTRARHHYRGSAAGPKSPRRVATGQGGLQHIRPEATPPLATRPQAPEPARPASRSQADATAEPSGPGSARRARARRGGSRPRGRAARCTRATRETRRAVPRSAISRERRRTSPAPRSRTSCRAARRRRVGRHRRGPQRSRTGR